MFTTAILIVSSILFIRTFHIRITLTSDAFGPRTLPQIISGSIAAWSVFQIVRLLRLRARDWSTISSVEDIDDIGSAQVAEILTMAVEDDGVIEVTPAFGWVPKPPSQISRRVVITVSLFLYVIAMQFIGFIASTYLFSLVGLWMFEEESPRVMIALPIVLSVGMYALFEYLLHVRLP
jgi:Tripartite tricarboxylate transporter TctB family